MTASTESAGLKALRYAEQNLGVNAIYESCLELRGKLDETLSLLSEARDKKRELESKLVDVEMFVAADERGKHADMSQAAMDKHLKVALHSHPEWRTLRADLANLAGDMDGLEMDKAMHETDIKIAVSRMQELGGYLQYLAAIKQSEVAREASAALKEVGTA